MHKVISDQEGRSLTYNTHVTLGENLRKLDIFVWFHFKMKLIKGSKTNSFKGTLSLFILEVEYKLSSATLF